jgi:glucose-6-phosphate 1-dehydrogenase
VRTGKRLPQRITEVAIAFQRPPQLPLFPGSDPEPDALLLRIAPSEGLSIRFGAKVPGRSFHVRQASMDFAYGEGFPHGSAEAYERVIFDALLGDPTLFIRADEVGRSWRIVDPIIEYWAASCDPIPLYQAGTWGPREANDLAAADGRRWRHSAR